MNHCVLRGALCAPLYLYASSAHAVSGRADGKLPVQNFPETTSLKPAIPASIAYPTESAGEGTTVDGYNLHRWAEDWRSRKDPKNRKDFIDRLKFLPLDADGDVYLTLSGEVRARINYVTNPGLRTGASQRQDALRLVGGADVHFGSHFRLYGELASGQLGGENLGTRATNWENDIVAQQYFAEATTNLGPTVLGVRYGRQEFSDGSPLLVSQRDNNNIRFVLNGLRSWARTANLRVDVVDLEFTRLGSEGMADDKIDHDRRFSGFTAGYALPKTLFGKSKLYLEPFAWRLRTRTQSWGSTSAREVRDYLGLRLWGSANRFVVDWSVNHQSGKFGARDIDATQVFLAQTMLVGKSPMKPRIGFHADYGSGGRSNGSGTLGTAASPFGNTLVFSYATALSPTNLLVLAPNLNFAPLKQLKITTEYEWAWRDRAGEPAYKSSGAAYAGTAAVPGRLIAQIARAQLVWNTNKRLSVTARYEHIFTGEVLERAKYRDSNYLAGWISYRF